jgi:hypothetical protein
VLLHPQCVAHQLPITDRSAEKSIPSRKNRIAGDRGPCDSELLKSMLRVHQARIKINSLEDKFRRTVSAFTAFRVTSNAIAILANCCRKPKSTG